MSDDELQERACRCCERSYRYPVPRSTATRFYCQYCVGLDAGVREMFELFNKRLGRLTSQIESLRRGGDSAGGGT